MDIFYGISGKIGTQLKIRKLLQPGYRKKRVFGILLLKHHPKDVYKRQALCHAAVGGDKAFAFLMDCGWTQERARLVKEAIAAHRYRSKNPPVSVEAKILFDADKLDVTGAIGIARTLLYAGETGCPLYTMNSDGSVNDGSGDGEDCFFREYKRKLEKLYDRFFTERGTKLAAKRRAAAEAFYGSLLMEAEGTYRMGKERLSEVLKGC